MREYSVWITVEMATTFTAETEEEAILAAEDWMGFEYGDLTHTATYKVMDGDK